MSWHFSRALVADFLRVKSSAGAQSAPSKSTSTDGESSNTVSPTECSRRSQSGMTSELSTGLPGGDVLRWCLEAFPAKPIPRRLEAKTRRMISGRRCGEWWQKFLPGTSLPRTSREQPLRVRPTISKRWVMKPAVLPFQRRTWARTTLGSDIGYVHTPTATANYAAPSMQKWAVCRNFVATFGAPTPEIHEYLMDWPIGWSGLAPLETDRWFAWLYQHGDA
jgi:hypothetical protein